MTLTARRLDIYQQVSFSQVTAWQQLWEMQNKSRMTDVTLYHWVYGSQHCTGLCHFHLQGQEVFLDCRWHNCVKYWNHCSYNTAWHSSFCEFLAVLLWEPQIPHQQIPLSVFPKSQTILYVAVWGAGKVCISEFIITWSCFVAARFLPLKCPTQWKHSIFLFLCVCFPVLVMDRCYVLSARHFLKCKPMFRAF